MSLLKPIEHLFKKIVLFFLDIISKKHFVDSVNIQKDREYKILFVRPEKIGDLFIVYPVFNKLIEHYPKIKISLVISPECLPLVEKDIWFHKIFIYKKDIWADRELFRMIRAEKYDSVVDLVGRDSVLSLLISMYCAPNKPRIAVGKDKLSKYYDVNYDLRNNNTGHVITNSMKLLNAFGISYENSDCYASPYIDEDIKQKADDIINHLDVNMDESIIIGFNLSAGSAGRKLADKVAIELLDKIISHKDNIRVVLFAIGEDRESAESIAQKIGEKVKVIPDGLTLIEASAVISKLDLFMTPDTSLVHIARSFKIPVVAFYRKNLENYKIWYPIGQSNGIVLSNNDDNISDLTADMIYTEFIKLFNFYALEERCQTSRLS